MPLARRKVRGGLMVCAGIYKSPPAGHARPGLRPPLGGLAGAAALRPVGPLRPGPGLPAPVSRGAGPSPGAPRAAARWGPPGRCVASAARSPGPWVLRPGVRCLRAAPARRGGPWPLPPCLGPGRPAPGPPPRPGPAGPAARFALAPRSSRPGAWAAGPGKVRPAFWRLAPPAAPGRGGLGVRVGGLFRLRRLLFKTSLELFGSPSRPFNPGAAHSLAKQGQGCGSCDPLRSRIAKSGAWAFARAPLHSNSDPYSAFPYFRLYSSYDMA